MLWEILKASKGILVADFYADLWANIAGGGTPVDVFVEMIGSLPLYYDGKGIDLADYLISGNTVQDGTPTPEAPVDVVVCGAWDEAQQSFKLPLTVNSVEYPIYLGTVPTTRRVKKLVLTGQENWVYEAAYTRFKLSLTDMMFLGIRTTPILCSHYITIDDGRALSNIPNNAIYVGGAAGAGQIAIKTDEYNTESGFKGYLAQQYAAGIPVTLWYVLAEPETGIVNEPLMKIGDYADTVSFAQAGVTIPTVSGANVLDMTSPVKPSEVYIKGKSIKPTDYGQLTDVNGVNILDKNGNTILVHGQ